MKIKVNNYTFAPVSKTITFNDFSTISLDSILMVTNVTTGTILYLFSDSAKGGSINGNILTLSYNTTSMSASDQLQIWIDNGAEYPITRDQLSDCIDALSNALYVISNPSYLDKSANQIRAQITGTLTTLTTCTTVTTVGTVTNMGSYPATMGVFDINNASWAAVARSTLA